VVSQPKNIHGSISNYFTDWGKMSVILQNQLDCQLQKSVEGSSPNDLNKLAEILGTYPNVKD